jgi:broad-specificity NMP kinase
MSCNKNKTAVEEEPTLSDLFKLMKNQGDQLATITNKIAAIEHIES